MDPRKPELAVARIKELIEQYDRIEKDMANATTSAKLGQLEREGGLVVQEICLVAPRIHEALMQTSRQRRHDLSHGVVNGTDFDRLLGLLNEAKNRFMGDSIMAKNKKTGKTYESIGYTRVNPADKNIKLYRVAVSIYEKNKEVYFFKDDEIEDFLNLFEPVEKPVEERRSEALAEIAKQTERIGEQISEIADTVTEKVEKTAKKKPAKKKTTKKANK